MRVVLQCDECLHFGAIVEYFEFDAEEKDDITLFCVCPKCKHESSASLKEWLASVFDEEAEA